MRYESGYLSHHGIKGQQWGVRRFQNDDGTLTEEGRARYGHLKEREDKGLFKKYTIGSEGGVYAFAKWRERRHKKNLNKWQNKETNNDAKKEKKIQKYQSKLDAQSAANKNLDAYRKHHSAAQLIMQNSIPIGGSLYRHARARGEGRVSSLIEGLTPVGPILRMIRDKKAYGKYLVYGNTDGEAL